jgi:hypothetical protein
MSVTLETLGIDRLSVGERLGSSNKFGIAFPKRSIRRMYRSGIERSWPGDVRRPRKSPESVVRGVTSSATPERSCNGLL